LVLDMLPPQRTGRARPFPRGAADQQAKPPVHVRRVSGSEEALSAAPIAGAANSLGFAQGRCPDPANPERRFRVFPSARSPAASSSEVGFIPL
jgi:hypothetical protein